MRVVAALLLLALAGCLGSGSVTCADGRICPKGTMCVDDRDLCVTQDQIDQCETANDGVHCDYPGPDDGVCVGHICVPVGCGDGFADAPEECDGDDLAGHDCTFLGYHPGGTLGCRADCTYDDSQCGTWCGDGAINGGEACDGAMLGGVDCTDFHFYDPAGLQCTACTFDASACTGFCGDDIVNGDELCDALPSTTDTCTTFGYEAGVMSCSAFCSPGFDSCVRTGWRAVLTVPSFGRFEGVWGSASDDVYAVGEHGAYHWNGTAWSVEASLPDVHLMDVWAAAPDDVYAVGLGGAIHHRDAAGWTAMTSGTTADLYAVWGAGPGDVYAVGDHTIRHYDGSGWTEVYAPATIVRDVAGSGASDVYAIGDDRSVLHRGAGGWAIAFTEPTYQPRAVWANGPGDVLVAGALGWARHYDGAAWSDRYLLASDDVSALWGTGDQMWAGFDNGQLERWDGAAWQARSSSAPAITGVWGVGPGRIFATGDGGTILAYDGLTIRRLPLDTVKDLGDVELLADGDVVATARDGEIYVRRAGLWNTVTTFTGTPLEKVWGTDIHTMMAVGAGGLVVRGDALSWTVDDPGTTADLFDVWGSSPVDIYVVGAGVVRRWNGFVWAPVAFAGVAQANWHSIWGSGPDDVWIVGKGPPAAQPVARHWDGTTWNIVPIASGIVVDGGGGAEAVLLDGIVRVYGAAYDVISPGVQDGTIPPEISDLSVVGRDDMLAVGNHGFIAHFDGVAWRPVASASFQALAAADYRDGAWMVVGDGGTALEVIRDGAPAGGCPAAVETACGNGADDDCDFLADDRDPDCRGDGICWAAAELPCGVAVAGSTAHGALSIDTYGCGVTTLAGAERVYRLVPAASGELDVTISGITGGDPDLFAIGAAPGGACNPSGLCLASSIESSPTQTLAVSVTAGQPVYIAVDSNVPAVDYTLEATCP